jgi:hypothetical protein
MQINIYFGCCHHFKSHRPAGEMLLPVYWNCWFYYILLMSESRVSELLKRSRSRHEVVISKELRKVSADYQNQKAKSREANESLRKMMSEMRYF